MSPRRRGRGRGWSLAVAGGANVADIENAEVFTGEVEPSVDVRPSIAEPPIQEERPADLASQAVEPAGNQERAVSTDDNGVQPHAGGHFQIQPSYDGSEDQRPRHRRNRNRGGGQRSGQAPVAAAVAETSEAAEPEDEAGASSEPDASSTVRTVDDKPVSCTMAQMRRFIKSRPYVPIHELRRRFAIEGHEDDVNPVATDKGTIYVGLPPQEARYLGDLIKAGEVGCELLLDPCSPAVVGVYAMRPVARQ